MLVNCILRSAHLTSLPLIGHHINLVNKFYRWIRCVPYDWIILVRHCHPLSQIITIPFFLSSEHVLPSVQYLLVCSCYSAGFNSYKSAVEQCFSLATNQPYKSAEADLTVTFKIIHCTEIRPRTGSGSVLLLQYRPVRINLGRRTTWVLVYRTLEIVSAAVIPMQLS